MKNSKLWELLSVLPPSFIKDAGRWIQSPFYNRKDQLIRLWEYLEQCLKKAQLPETHEHIFSATFPNEDFDINKLRLATSDLYKLLLEFVAYQEWQKEPLSSYLYQVRFLRKAGLNKLAQQQLKQGLQLSERYQIRNADYFRLRYEMMAERYTFDTRSRPTENTPLRLLSATADIALLSAKLRQACLAISHQSVYSSDYQPGFTEEAIRYIADNGLESEPAIGLYYYCYFMMQDHSTDSYFQEFKKLLFQHGASFPEAETRELHLMGINYCIQQVNQGDESYFDAIMDFYKKGILGGYLLENGVLSRFTYYNIVAAGLRTGQYNWVKQFIHDYRVKLDRYYRESSFSFCLARLEYAQQKYEDALPLLQKANYRDPLLNLSAKTLLLKIYYETDEYELLHAHLDAMQNYIRRKRVIGYHKTNYLNIIRYTRKLVAVNHYDKKALEKLYTQIETEEVLTEKRWLLGRIRGLGV